MQPVFLVQNDDVGLGKMSGPSFLAADSRSCHTQPLVYCPRLQKISATGKYVLLRQQLFSLRSGLYPLLYRVTSSLPLHRPYAKPFHDFPLFLAWWENFSWWPTKSVHSYLLSTEAHTLFSSSHTGLSSCLELDHGCLLMLFPCLEVSTQAWPHCLLVFQVSPQSWFHERHPPLSFPPPKIRSVSLIQPLLALCTSPGQNCEHFKFTLFVSLIFLFPTRM